MNVNRTARIATAALVIALGAVLVVRTRSTPEAAPAGDPQSAVYAMLDAARSGNVPAYMTAFTGKMEATLRQTLAESTEPAFAKYLRESNASVKGIAVSEPETISDREVKVRAEYIYQDRNEAQTMYLKKGSNGWKVSRLDTDARIKTLIPYGTAMK